MSAPPEQLAHLAGLFDHLEPAARLHRAAETATTLEHLLTALNTGGTHSTDVERAYLHGAAIALRAVAGEPQKGAG